MGTCKQQRKFLLQTIPLITALFQKVEKEKKSDDPKIDLTNARAVREYVSHLDPEIGKLFASADEEYLEAEKYLKQAIELDKDFVIPWHMYATCLIGQAKQKEGKDAADHAIKLYDAKLVANPKDTNAYLGKFGMFMLLQDVDSARGAIIAGLKQNPDDPKLLGLKTSLKIE